MHALSPTFIPLPERSDLIRFEVVFPYASRLATVPPYQEVPHLLEHYLNRRLTENALPSHARTGVQQLRFTLSLSPADLSEKLPRFLTLLFDASFTQPEIFTAEKRILRNELAGSLDTPAERCQDLFFNTLLPTHPPYVTSLTDYDHLTERDIETHYHTFCTPDQAQLFIGLPKGEKALKKEITRLVNAVSLPAVQSHRKPEPAYHFPAAATTQYSQPTQRVYVTLGFPLAATTITLPEKLALVFALDLLSTTEDGLLWQALQQEAGLIYNLDEHLDYYGSFGIFSLSTAFFPADTDRGIAIMQEQLRRIQRGEYPPSLLKQVQEDMAVSDKEEWESNSGRFAWVIGDLLERDRIYPLEEWCALCQQVTTTDISKTFARVALTDKTQVVLLGKGEGDKQSLAHPPPK